MNLLFFEISKSFAFKTREWLAEFLKSQITVEVVYSKYLQYIYSKKSPQERIEMGYVTLNIRRKRPSRKKTTARSHSEEKNPNVLVTWENSELNLENNPGN